MILAGLLEALVPADQFRIIAGDDVALAEQRATSGFAGLHISHRIVARKRSGIVEVLMLVDSSLVRGTTGHRGQHRHQPGNTHGK
ncbi:hypothetical protein D3C76_1546770 [compost metagenome]